MSLKNKFLSVTALTVAVGAFSVMASAQDNSAATTQDNTQKVEKRERGFGKRGGKGMHGGKFGRHGGMMRGFRDLNLTDAQKEQFRAIREANRPDEATKTEMRSLIEAKRAGTLTAEQQERFQTLKQQGREKAQAVHQQIMAILTPEQLQQLEQKKAEMKQRWEERRQMRKQNAPQSTEKPTDN
ncbi:MAG TPA: Spy/CpxP family protein refolding chaperone [Pyrinomonadaceae bacterium]|nr:Spy/CpxP family protein refolding chaperone [Pyrinomonadaceae bacterium]